MDVMDSFLNETTLTAGETNNIFDNNTINSGTTPSPWNSSIDWDVDVYLANYLGPKQLAMETVIPITVVYLLIFISGVVGNVAVCAVIIRNPTMHTATNCYLFSLAVSDLTVLLFGLPNDLSVYYQQYPWALGEIVCRLRALIAEMTNYASVLTIVAFSLERYLAICHPLHAYKMAGLGRAAKIVALIWLVAFISALPFAIYTRIEYVVYPADAGSDLFGQPIPESAFCAMLDENQPAQWPLVEMATFIFFIVPMGILCLLYLRIGIRIRRTSLGRGRNVQQGVVHHSNESRQCSSRKNILRMLVAVVIGFFVCWAPFHSQRLLYVYAKDSPNFREINEKMFFITGCFYYFSSTINPILYNVMSARYREAFRETLCGYSSANHRNSQSFGAGRRSSERLSAMSRNGGGSRMTERHSLRTISSANNGAAGATLMPEERIMTTTELDPNNGHAAANQPGTIRCGMMEEPSLSSSGRRLFGGSPDHQIKPVNEWRTSSSSNLLNTANTKGTVNNSGSAAGTSLPAGCTPSCLKSSQLVRRASEASPPPSSEEQSSTADRHHRHEPSTDNLPVNNEACPLLVPNSGVVQDNDEEVPSSAIQSSL